MSGRFQRFPQAVTPGALCALIQPWQMHTPCVTHVKDER